MRVAIFDFDGTLYSKETFQLLMNHLKEHPLYHHRYNKFIRKLLPTYIGYKLKLIPQPKMKEKSMQAYILALHGLTQEELESFFEEMKNKMEKDFNPQVVQLVHDHHANNIHTMLVSGAFTPFLQAVTNELPFTTIIGTTIPFHNEQVDSTIPTMTIQGERKTEQVKQALNNETVDWSNSFAYGDSFSDKPVLSIVGKPVAVQPDTELRKYALHHRWEILD